jgi:hypothetical protein
MNETLVIENYLLGQTDPADSLLMDAKLLIDAKLSDTVTWQQQTYALIKIHGRNCLKREIEAAHIKVFSEKRFERFRKKISAIFK